MDVAIHSVQGDRLLAAFEDDSVDFPAESFGLFAHAVHEVIGKQDGHSV